MCERPEAEKVTDTIECQSLNSRQESLCSYHYAKQIIDNSRILVAETDTSHVIGAIEATEDRNGLIIGSLEMHISNDSLLAEAIGGEQAVVALDQTIAAQLIPSKYAESGDIIGFVETRIDPLQDDSEVRFGLFSRYAKEQDLAIETIIM